MILTLTINPSIDRLARLDQKLLRGGVYRLPMPEDMAGGKGINVSEAVHLAGSETLAIYPAARSGKFSRLLEFSGIPHLAIDTNNEARVNLTIAEADGTTTKLNSPGFSLTKGHRRKLLEQLAAYSASASWVVLAGSLPPGVPRNFYSTCISTIRKSNPEVKIALDTSDGPLEEVSKVLGRISPTLMKPNAFELGQLVGIDGNELEQAALRGDYGPTVDAARALNDRGVEEVLATLGEAGAVLAMSSGDVLVATPPPVNPVSTVGAGDCALAGYVLGRKRNLPLEECLALSVAYGAAATSLPSTTIPTPQQVSAGEAKVWPFNRSTR